MSSDSEYSLALPFLTNDPVFTRGVEIGLLWAALDGGKNPTHSAMIHADNDEQVIVIASRLGYRLTMENLDHGWKHVLLEKDFANGE